jgi:hypothetical protein
MRTIRDVAADHRRHVKPQNRGDSFDRCDDSSSRWVLRGATKSSREPNVVIGSQPTKPRSKTRLNIPLKRALSAVRRVGLARDPRKLSFPTAKRVCVPSAQTC